MPSLVKAATGREAEEVAIHEARVVLPPRHLPAGLEPHSQLEATERIGLLVADQLNPVVHLHVPFVQLATHLALDPLKNKFEKIETLPQIL